jgi:low temperature requirement protein LtrA
MPIYSGLYSGFKCRHEWNADNTDIVTKAHEDSGEVWITVFIDLVYVAMFINLGHVLEGCGTGSDVTIMAFSIFLIMFNSRLAIDEYSNRFFADDIFHRVVYFVYTFGVLVMTMNIVVPAYDSGSAHRLLRIEPGNDSDSTPFNHSRSLVAAVGNCKYVEDYWDGFMYGFVGTRLSLIALYSAVCLDNQKAKTQFITNVVKHSCSLVIGAVALFETAGTPGYFFTAAIIEIFFSILPRALEILKDMGFLHVRRIKETYPLDVYEYQSRLGIFYMMVLGESMIQLLQRVYATHLEQRVYYFVL